MTVVLVLVNYKTSPNDQEEIRDDKARNLPAVKLQRSVFPCLPIPARSRSQHPSRHLKKFTNEVQSLRLDVILQKREVPPARTLFV